MVGIDRCCNSLFSGFVFEDLRNANPPEKKGIYVIRVRNEGKPVKDIKEITTKLVGVLNWSIVGDYMLDRISRIEKIGGCPVIYIGAGSRREEQEYFKRTIQGLLGASHSNVSDLDPALFWLGIRIWLEGVQEPKRRRKQIKRKI